MEASTQQPIRVKTRRMLPDIVDQYGPQSSHSHNHWSLKVQPTQNNGKTYISVFANNNNNDEQRLESKTFWQTFLEINLKMFRETDLECVLIWRKKSFYMNWSSTKYLGHLSCQFQRTFKNFLVLFIVGLLWFWTKK